MAREESGQERWAREAVEAHLGVELAFVDRGVPVDSLHDFEFDDASGRRVALEVTTSTDEKLKHSVDGFRRSLPMYGSGSSLSSCWMVTVTQRDARYRDLPKRLEPHLAVLERVGVRYDEHLLLAQVSDRHGGQDQDVAAAVEALRRAKVEYVTRWPGSLCAARTVGDDVHAHRVEVAMVGGFNAKGSDASLAALEADVAARGDNLRKLRDSGTDRRHLFVALDWATEGGVSRPFRGDDVTEWEHFGIPTRAPSLPQEVDELWVVFESTGIGWHWDGERWEKVTGSAREFE